MILLSPEAFLFASVAFLFGWSAVSQSRGGPAVGGAKFVRPLLPTEGQPAKSTPLVHKIGTW